MKRYNLSEFDFDAINPVSVPKQLKDITNLYRACKFDEANALLEKFGKLPHQVLDIKAQLAFFKWDFDEAVKYILEYYPFLGEWYSGNKTDDTQRMLVFSLMNASPEVKSEAMEILQEMYGFFNEEQLQKRNLRYFKLIPQIIDAANGNYESYQRIFVPSEKHLSYEDILQEYSAYHKIKLDSLKSSLEDDARTAGDVLSLIRDNGEPSDFVRLYEKHCKTSKLYYRYHIEAIKIYLYLGELDKARAAAVNYVKYGFIPIEWTDIMPLSVFDNYSFIPVFTKGLFNIIYNTPKGVDEKTRSESESLNFNGNFDELFEQAKNNENISVVEISKLSIPSGKVVVSDPLVSLGKDTPAYARKVPKGEYSVKALISGKRIAAVMVPFTDNKAVKYVNALIGNETQAEIDELGEEGFFGFPVDSGLAVICDDKVKREYVKLVDKWSKKHKDTDFYTGYLSPLFKRSAEDYPEYQDEDGSYIDFVIPDTEYHMPIFSTGAGDGYYPVFFGYDGKGKVCSIAAAFEDF